MLDCYKIKLFFKYIFSYAQRERMFRNTLRVVIASLLLVSSVLLAQDGMSFNAASGDKEDAYNDMVNEKLESIGFVLSDPHEQINEAYSQKYSQEKDYEETLDNLGFFPVSNDVALRPLLMKEPRLGAFSPFNLHIYKYKNEDVTHVGHLSPTVILDIVGAKDKDIRTDFIKMFEPLDTLVNAEIGGKREVFTFKKLPKKKLMEFELKFERPDELLDFIEGFQEKFEGAFEENKYIIAGYKNFSEVYADREEDFSRYDTYFVYSVCHFYFSYKVFNYGNAQAGAFAPCSMYMYVEKDSNVMHIGMAYLENWISVAGIKDAEQIKSIRAIDKDMIRIMQALGAKLK